MNLFIKCAKTVVSVIELVRTDPLPAFLPVDIIIIIIIIRFVKRQNVKRLPWRYDDCLEVQRD